MTFQLVLLEGGRVVRKVRAIDRLVIGRGEDCALQVSDGSVSARHAQIVEERGELLIEDLGSHNKTVVERGPTLDKGQRAPLCRGMTLVLGRVRIAVEEEEEEDALPGQAAAARRKELPEPDRTVGDPAALEPPAPEGEITLRAPPSMALPPLPPPAIPAPSGATTHEPASDSSTLVPGSPASPLVAHAFIQGLHPRLIVDNDALRKVIELGSKEFVIGRKEGALTLNHPRISNPHARIFFEPELERMFLEDLGSKNGTFLNGELLKPRAPRQLPAEAHLRFGTLDALFLLEKDYDGESLAFERSKAVELLSRLNKTNPTQERRALEEAGKQKLPPGACLVLTGAITAAEWVQALADARIVLLTDAVVGKEIRTLKLWVAFLLLAFLGLLALYLIRVR